MYSRRALTEVRQRQETDSAPAPVDWDAMFDAPTMTWEEAVLGSLRDHLAKNPPQPPPPEVTETSAVCGSTRVWLVRDGERWEMYAGSRKTRGRRTDFASPFLRHSMEVAEDWYGKTSAGWSHQAQKMPSQTSPE
jgi:hypothetical protein